MTERVGQEAIADTGRRPTAAVAAAGGEVAQLARYIGYVSL